MKTKFTTGAPLPTGNGCENGISFSGMLKSVFILFAVFVCINANAQIAPASNLRGPLKAVAGGANVSITSEIQSETTPTTSYTLVNNTSGATIVSQGAYQVNKGTGIGTQTIVVNPGSAKGSFTLHMKATTSLGTCEASKSVTVAKSIRTANQAGSVKVTSAPIH